MISEKLARLVEEAARSAQAAGKLPAGPLPTVGIERPRSAAHGDYATPFAMQCTKIMKVPPLKVGQALVEGLDAPGFLERVDLAPPGFINFTLSKRWLAQQVDEIVRAGERFAAVDVGQGRRVQVEFVSANPTGPLHVASGRAGALGDALANVMALAGFQVEREYYINDAGSRMGAFYASAWARYLQQLGREAEVPADGYHGAYMIDIAKEIVAREGDRFLQVPAETAEREVGQLALGMVLASARNDMERLGVHYDRWFSEQSLFDSGAVARVIEHLRERGFVAEREGAIWFTSSALGEDKDNVLVRSNGIPTYFASDLAYHYDKFVTRGFDHVIDIWGADHQGHVPRMRAAIEALGIDPNRLTLLIHQMITLRRGTQVVRMSKRTGDLITLGEVLDEVGRDACRFFFLLRSADSQMDFDLELAKEQSDENPVYYVQYAHARICNIFRVARERGVIESEADLADADLSLLTADEELALVRRMLELPELVERIAQTLEPHALPHYAQQLAATFHHFYTHHVVLGDDPALTRARLKLVLATRIVLATTLSLMGVSAPESM